MYSREPPTRYLRSRVDGSSRRHAISISRLFGVTSVGISGIYVPRKRVTRAVIFACIRPAECSSCTTSRPIFFSYSLSTDNVRSYRAANGRRYCLGSRVTSSLVHRSRESFQEGFHTCRSRSTITGIWNLWPLPDQVTRII